MSFLLEIVGYGGITPLIVSGTVVFLIRRCCADDVAVRYAVPLGLLAGFTAAYGLLPWAPLRPEAHWHFLPYVAAAAVLIGPVALAGGVLRRERWALHFAIGLLTALLLIPDWEEIAPMRTRYLAAVAVGVPFLSVSIESLAARIQGALPAAVLVVAFITGAFVLEESGSLKFAQLGGAVAAAMAGCIIAITRFGRSGPQFRSVALPVSTLLVGLIFSGYVNSFSGIPASAYALVVVSPLAVAICLLPAASKLSAGRKWTVGFTAVLAVLAAAVLLTVGS